MLTPKLAALPLRYPPRGLSRLGAALRRLALSYRI